MAGTSLSPGNASATDTLHPVLPDGAPVPPVRACAGKSRPGFYAVPCGSARNLWMLPLKFLAMLRVCGQRFCNAARTIYGGVSVTACQGKGR